MARKRFRVKGDAWSMKQTMPPYRFIFSKMSYRYHIADRGGRMYWCGCSPDFRIGDKYKCCLNGKRRQRTNFQNRSYWSIRSLYK